MSIKVISANTIVTERILKNDQLFQLDRDKDYWRKNKQPTKQDKIKIFLAANREEEPCWLQRGAGRRTNINILSVTGHVSGFSVPVYKDSDCCTIPIKSANVGWLRCCCSCPSYSRWLRVFPHRSTQPPRAPVPQPSLLIHQESRSNPCLFFQMACYVCQLFISLTQIMTYNLRWVWVDWQTGRWQDSRSVRTCWSSSGDTGRHLHTLSSHLSLLFIPSDRITTGHDKPRQEGGEGAATATYRITAENVEDRKNCIAHLCRTEEEICWRGEAEAGRQRGEGGRDWALIEWTHRLQPPSPFYCVLGSFHLSFVFPPLHITVSSLPLCSLFYCTVLTTSGTTQNNDHNIINNNNNNGCPAMNWRLTYKS